MLIVLCSDSRLGHHSHIAQFREYERHDERQSQDHNTDSQCADPDEEYVLPLPFAFCS